MPRAAYFPAGTRFGRLTILNEDERRYNLDGSVYRNWLCQCDCGNQTVARTQSLTKGSTKSCGCYQKQRASESSRKWSPAEKELNNRWRAIHNRCYNSANVSFHNYGARGIIVCERWHVFENFMQDVGLPDTDETLERINNTLGYFPENCRWATRAEQTRNTRQNVFVSVKGETMCLADAADTLGVTPGAFYMYQKRNDIDDMQAVIDIYVKRKLW
jgi:hypothetical protein